MTMPSAGDIEAFLSHVVDGTEAVDQRCTPGQVADALVSAGLPPGAVVFVRSANSHALLACFFGVLLAGGVPALVPPGQPRSTLLDQAVALGAGHLLRARGSAPVPGGVARAIGPVEHVLLPTGADIRHRPGQVIMLTSGTSGLRSACLMDLSALVQNARKHAMAVDLRPSDVVLVNLPLYFSYALVAQCLAALGVGARLVVSGPPFTAAGYAGTLAEHGVTSSSLTPYLVRSLLAAGWARPGRLRALTVGGDALAREHLDRLLADSPGADLYITYGLTEAGPRVSTLAAHRESGDRLNSVGQALGGVRLSQRFTGSDGIGELVVESDTVMRRRVGVADERPRTQVIGPRLLATGDLCRIDACGYLFIEGRIGDFVVSRGTKVSLSSVRRLANGVHGVVSSSTRLRGDTAAGGGYALDVFVADPEAAGVEQVRRALLRRLARPEWPDELRVLPTSGERHK